MKVAVIGANGQLGSDLIKVFDDVVPLTHQDLDIIKCETLDVIRKITPDVVVNAAAYVRVDDAETHPEEAFNVNAIGALNVARVCREIDVINVYISTDYVFDGMKREPYTEDDIPNPINVYGISKYAGEVFTQNYSPRQYIIRTASLYGRAGARGKGGNFVEAMLKKAKNMNKIEVVDDIFMSPTYTRDVARTLKKFLEMRPEYGVYHMVNSGYCSWYEFTKEIFEILNMNPTVNPVKSSEYPRPAKRPSFSALENRKIKRINLNLQKWEDALKEYLIETGRI